MEGAKDHLGREITDQQRRLAGDWLGAWVDVPNETPSQARPVLPGCELLSYGGSGPPILIIPAPIKRAYIWDLFPEASAVRRLLENGFSVHLLRWTEETVAIGAGLEFFTAEAPAEAFRRLRASEPPSRLVLAGHSLGGLFAAMTACLFPDVISVLVLIETPLVFKDHRLGFAAAQGGLLQPLLDGELTGTELTALSVALMPDEFVWKRWADAAFSGWDPHRMRLHLGVLRWAFDEFPLPSPLVTELLNAMAEDAFVSGELSIRAKAVGPAALRARTLAVSCRSGLTPQGSFEPFLEKCERAETHIKEFSAETGTALAHVSPLVGPAAQSQLWPQIAAWAKDAYSLSQA